MGWTSANGDSEKYLVIMDILYYIISCIVMLTSWDELFASFGHGWQSPNGKPEPLTPRGMVGYHLLLVKLGRQQMIQATCVLFHVGCFPNRIG